MKRKALRFEEKIEIIQYLEINERTYRPEGIYIAYTQEQG